MSAKRLILVVDDDVDASQMVKMILEKTGHYEVNICNRGSEALRVIRETKPELVLLDIMMPDADGTDIAEQVKQDASLAFTQIVFMTSLVSSKEETRHPVIGGRSFISKPVSAETLVERIKGFF